MAGLSLAWGQMLTEERSSGTASRETRGRTGTAHGEPVIVDGAGYPPCLGTAAPGLRDSSGGTAEPVHAVAQGWEDK